MNIAVSNGDGPTFALCVDCGEYLGTLAPDPEQAQREMALKLGAAHAPWCPAPASSAPATPGRAATRATPR